MGGSVDPDGNRAMEGDAIGVLDALGVFVPAFCVVGATTGRRYRSFKALRHNC